MATPVQITIDCHDPEALLAFWALALDYEPEPPPPGARTWREHYLSVGVPEDELGPGDCADRLRDPAGVGPKLWFQPVPEAKSVKNRLHLDLLVGRGRDLSWEQRRAVVLAKVAQLEAAGATRVRVLSETVGHFGVVLQDPEGNELCVT